MSSIYFYVDQATLDTLKNTRQKVILVGGDSGNSNFGDILQLKGTINFYKDESHCVPIPIFNLFNISDCDYINIMKKRLGIDGLIFVSHSLMDFEDTNLELVLVDKFMNCDLCHLYGGGFLNNTWGDQILNITESVLNTFQISHYVISGQQIETSFAEKVKEHISYFKPTLVGARDYDSLANLVNLGIESIYTFDDAVEELLKIADKIPSEKTKKILGHMNLSSYTNASEKQATIIHNFETLKNLFPEYSLVLFNAFNSNHYTVTDALGTLVEMENGFPYKSYSVIDGAALAYYGIVDDISLLAAEIAISSSYHTTLLMHLSGTPCWLISSNTYYDQKRSSLGVTGTLEDFLSSPIVPAYDEKLQARREWNKLLLQTITSIEVSQRVVTLAFNPQDVPQKFLFRTNGIKEKEQGIVKLQEGKDWLAEQYHSLMQAVKEKDQQIIELQGNQIELVNIKKSSGYRLLKKMKLLP